MSNRNRQSAGDIARQMAAAPLVTPKAPDAPVVEDSKTGQTNGVETPDTDTVDHRIPFVLQTFSLPSKEQKVYPNDDGSTIQRLATATVIIRGSQITFNAAVYLRTRQVKDAAGTGVIKECYVSLPSSGKGFPMPVFGSTDPMTQHAIKEWQADAAQEFAVWYRAALEARPKASAAGRPQSQTSVDVSDLFA